MSRVEVSDGQYTLAFGVAPHLGAFVQLWINPIYDRDCAAIVIDSFGVRADEEQTALLAPRIHRHVQNLKKRFDDWHKTHPNERPNIDEKVVTDLARCIDGFPDIRDRVYEIFD